MWQIQPFRYISVMMSECYFWLSLHFIISRGVRPVKCLDLYADCKAGDGSDGGNQFFAVVELGGGRVPDLRRDPKEHRNAAAAGLRGAESRF